MSPIALASLVLMVSGFTLAQRGSYSGRRPIGYPEIITTSTEAGLGDRFGEDASTTTQKLPIEALGDRELINRLSKLPIDKQPFWFINWQALEENRKHPQSYQPNPNSFIAPPNAGLTSQSSPTNQGSSSTNQPRVPNTPSRNNIPSNSIGNGQIIPTSNGQSTSSGNVIIGPTGKFPTGNNNQFTTSNAQLTSLGNNGIFVPTGSNGPLFPNNGQFAPFGNGQSTPWGNNGQFLPTRIDKQLIPTGNNGQFAPIGNEQFAPAGNGQWQNFNTHRN